MLVLSALALNCSRPTKPTPDYHRSLLINTINTLEYNTKHQNMTLMAGDSLKHYYNESTRLYKKLNSKFKNAKGLKGLDYIDAMSEINFFRIDSLFPVDEKIEFWKGYFSALDSVGLAEVDG